MNADRTPPPDVHTLTGPYVLGALPEGERTDFERHLGRCSSCRTEVAELQETVARLAGAIATDPPTRLKERVLAATDRTRQLPPHLAAEPSLNRGWLTRRSLFALAAGSALIAAAGGVALHQHQDAEVLRQHNAELTAVLAEADARIVRTDVAGGGRATVVSSTRRDTGIVLLDELPEPPRNRTYQLWFIERGTARSLGLAGDDRQTITVVHGGIARATAFGLTIEPEGGSARPTPPIIAEVPMT